MTSRPVGQEGHCFFFSKESGRSNKEAWLQHPTIEIYQIKKRNTHTHRSTAGQKKKRRSDEKDSLESHRFYTATLWYSGTGRKT